jgi:hypothetical protein
LFPYFQVLTHDIIRLELHVVGDVWHPACGAFVFLAFDLLLQSALIFWYTGTKWKSVWAFANCISPVEPILHGGDHPIFTAKPIAVSAVHLVEAMFAGLLVVWKHGNLQAEFDTCRDDFDIMLLTVCGILCVVQFPFLLIVQFVFAYHVNPRDRFTQASWYDSAHMDETDRAVPLSMILSASWDEIGCEEEGYDLEVTALQAHALRMVMSANYDVRSILHGRDVCVFAPVLEYDVDAAKAALDESGLEVADYEWRRKRRLQIELAEGEMEAPLTPLVSEVYKATSA